MLTLWYQIDKKRNEEDQSYVSFFYNIPEQILENLELECPNYQI